MPVDATRGHAHAALVHPGGLAAMRAQMPARLHTAAALDGAPLGRHYPGGGGGGHLNLYLQSTPLAAARSGSAGGGGGFGGAQ